MNHNFATLLLLSSLSLLSSEGMGFAEEGLHSYSIESYPRSSFGCDATAESLAGQFTAATGKPVFRATCDAETSEGYDISITYRSPRAVSVVSTANESGGIGTGFLGIYPSLPSCTTNLAIEVQRFTNATGLTTFVHYCYRESQSHGTPYVARIDAFGVARLYPNRFETHLFGRVIGGGADELAETVAGAEAQSIKFPLAALANDGEDKLVIRYFDAPEDSRPRFSYFSGATFGLYFDQHDAATAQAACQMSKNEARTTFAQIFSTPVVWFCSWDPRLFLARLYALRVRPREIVTVETVPVRFRTFVECHGERARMIAYYRRDLGKDAYGALCSWDDGVDGSGQRETFLMRVYLRD